MGMAHMYARLQSSVLKLKDELRFVSTGRLIAEIIIMPSGEPRLQIGEHQLPEEHARRLAAWILHVFEPEPMPNDSSMRRRPGESLTE